MCKTINVDTKNIDNSMAGIDSVRVYDEIHPCILSRLYKEPTMIISIERMEKVEENNNELKLIGTMDNTVDRTWKCINRVYDKNGVMPTITTMGGGNVQPKVLDVQELGFMDNGTGKHQSNTVYGTDGVCPTITTINGGGTQQIKIVEEKEIELASTSEKKRDCASTILAGYSRTNMTGFNADNCVVEKAVIVDDLYPNRQRVYKKYAPALRSERHDLKVVEEKKIKINQATKNGYIDCKIGGVACLDYPKSTLRRGRVIEDGNVSPTIMTGSTPSVIEYGDPNFYNFVYQIGEQYYLIRVRKLTPRECWRLMGFIDEDFEKAQEVNSNTQLYKQAGNSIVTNCLMAIFGQMIDGKEDVYKNNLTNQN